MNADLLDFLRSIRPSCAKPTQYEKFWILRAFHNFLLDRKKSFGEATKADVEEYLRSCKCGRRSRVKRCGVIRRFYDFLKRGNTPGGCSIINPAAEIAFKPDKTKKLPKVPSQATVEALLQTLNGAHSTESSYGRAGVRQRPSARRTGTA